MSQRERDRGDSPPCSRCDGNPPVEWLRAYHHELLHAAEVEMAALRRVAEEARNVVSQWRGDISRKPHIGRLRDALRSLDGEG